MNKLNYILIALICFLCFELTSQTGPKTKIRLYKQTTDLDSLNLAEKNPCWIDINQPAHGYPIVGGGIYKPFLGYINNLGEVVMATSDSLKNQGYGIVYVLDSDNLRYYVCDNIIETNAHGYTVGGIINLKDNGSFAHDTGTFHQSAYEVINNNNLGYLKHPSTFNDEGNIINILSYQEGSWYMGSGAIPNVIPKLTNQLNFGPSGTYNKVDSLIVDIDNPTIDAALLQQYDILVFSYMSDNTLTLGERAAIKNWVDNDGGKLIVYADYSGVDDLVITFGSSVSTSSSGTLVNHPAQGAHPLFAGPFGVVTTFGATGTIGYFNSLVGFTVLGLDNADATKETVLKYNGGHAVFFTNEGVQRINVNPGGAVTTANERLLCNLYAYLIDL